MGYGLEGLLGGLVGGASQIVQRNQQMDKEDETTRLETMRSDLQLSRQKAIEDYKVAKAEEMAGKTASAYKTAIGKPESKFTEYDRMDGEAEISGLKNEGSGLLGRTKNPTLQERSDALINSGDATLVSQGMKMLDDQDKTDYYKALTATENEKGTLYKKQNELIDRGFTKDGKAIGGSNLSQQRFDVKMSDKQVKDFMDENKSIWQQSNPSNPDGKPVENAVISDYMKKAARAGKTAEVMEAWSLARKGATDEKTGTVDEEKASANMLKISRAGISRMTSVEKPTAPPVPTKAEPKREQPKAKAADVKVPTQSPVAPVRDPLAGLTPQKAREKRDELIAERKRWEGKPNSAALIAEIDELIDRIKNNAY